MRETKDKLLHREKLQKNRAEKNKKSEHSNFFELGNTLTKLDIAQNICRKLNLNKREAKNLVHVFFKEISEILRSGEVVKLPGFGQFKVRKKSARPGRNPKTGESFEIAARSVTTFQVSQCLKQCIEEEKIMEK